MKTFMKAHTLSFGVCPLSIHKTQGKLLLVHYLNESQRLLSHTQMIAFQLV